MATFEETFRQSVWKSSPINPIVYPVARQFWQAGAASRDAKVAQHEESIGLASRKIASLVEILADLRSKIEAAQAQLERATDLVRYARHFLHEEELISDDEYAVIVQDNEDGKRVARLEGYDKSLSDLRSKIEAARTLAERLIQGGGVFEVITAKQFLAALGKQGEGE